MGPGFQETTMGRFTYTTYVQFNADIDFTLGWTTGKVVKFNGVVADWFVNIMGQGIETDSGGIPA